MSSSRPSLMSMHIPPLQQSSTPWILLLLIQLPLLLSLNVQFTDAFVFPLFQNLPLSLISFGRRSENMIQNQHHQQQRRSCYYDNTQLYSGRGIATDYTWTEEAFEIEVAVKVPKNTRAKDIRFKATPTSIELWLLPRDGSDNDNEELMLLDPSRKLRGNVVLDGTYWTISDEDDVTSSNHRLVTVTIEKKIKSAKDDFDVVEYDWNGVYSQDEEEVSYRKYDEPEELDVREYASSLGVDIDNINMSMVDKTMFTSGLNLTKSSLDSLNDAGLIKEVTKQSDGSEWTTNKDGEKVPFQSMGDGITAQEVEEATSSSSSSPTIPFLDTDSPWHKAVPVNKKDRDDVADGNDDDSTATSTTHFTIDTDDVDVDVDREADTEAASKRSIKQEKQEILQNARKNSATDPIETLTVARLKDILRSRGLKVSGNKKELQERLRSEVQTMLVNDNDNSDGQTERSTAEKARSNETMHQQDS